MGENELGLKKAILSGEDDLVYLSVMHIEQEAGSSEKGREAFCELMLAHPEALRLLKVGLFFFLCWVTHICSCVVLALRCFFVFRWSFESNCWFVW